MFKNILQVPSFSLLFCLLMIQQNMKSFEFCKIKVNTGSMYYPLSVEKVTSLT